MALLTKIIVDFFYFSAVQTVTTSPSDMVYFNFFFVLARVSLMPNLREERRLKRRRSKNIKPLWRSMRSRSNISVTATDNH